MSELLRLEGVVAGYGDVEVLDIDALSVGEGEVVSVVGANGTGKTTLLSTISGLVRPSRGRIVFDGRELTNARPTRVVAEGIVMVPEGRRLFPDLTVRENLLLGAYHRAARRRQRETLDEVLERFPRLAERREQLAGSLSGGEQQMCAIARGLMARPRILMLDEPSLGLSPAMVETVFALTRTLREAGLTLLLVEQNVGEALELSDRAYVLEQGRVAMADTAEAVLANPRVRDLYLGV